MLAKITSGNNARLWKITNGITGLLFLLTTSDAVVGFARKYNNDRTADIDNAATASSVEAMMAIGFISKVIAPKELNRRAAKSD
jgi:hypothetical protein